MKKVVLLLLFISYTNLQGQVDTLWTRTFGGADFDAFKSIQQTTDGGYIIGGETWSYGAGLSDAWLIKINSNGNEEWNQTFGGSAQDYANSILQTTDGGYIIGGETWSYGAGLSDAWLIKINSNGNEEWNQTFGGSAQDYANSILQTTDGGYIIAGRTESNDEGDVWLIKTDSEGNEEWNKTFGGSDSDRGRSVQQTADGGYIVAGYTQSFGNGSFDAWLIKTDSQGNEEWDKTFGGSDYDAAKSVQQTTDGGYIIAGDTYSFGNGENDVWLIKTDSQGNTESFVE
jgi:hypothetical protein